MAAPKNNKNAGKWTEVKVLTYLEQIDAAAKDPKQLFLGRILESLGLYKDVWRYWKNKYAAAEEIIDLMELIETKLEVNVFKAGLFGDIPAWLAIKCLKHIYGWREDNYEAEEKSTIIIRHRQIEQHEYPRARAA